MSELCRLLLAVLLILPSAGLAISKEDSSVFAITNVNVIPMDSERTIENQTVIIKDRKIIAIGSSNEIKKPTNAKSIDGSGKYLIPGLFDMHIHIDRGREKSLALYLANGITTVRNMSGNPWHIKLRERIAKNEVIGPRFFTTSPTTFSARIKNAPEDAEKFVVAQKKAGYDSIKMYGTRPDYAMTRETYNRLLVTAKKLNMRIVGHTPRGLPFQAVLDEGQASVDHAEEIYYVYRPVLEKLGSVADFQFGKISLEDYRKMEIKFPDLQTEIQPLVKKLARDVKKSDLVFSPGLITYETILRQITSEYPQMLADPKMQYVYPLWRLYVSPGFNSYRGRWSGRLNEMTPILKNTYEIQKLLVSEFHKAGVPLMAGTDATNPFVIEGFSLHDELQKLVDSGLSPYDALKAATYTPAKFLEIDKKIGTIAAGKNADLVLLDKNPLANIKNTREISGVSVNGKWFSKSKLDQSIKDLAISYQPFWNAIQGSRKYFSNGDVKGALEFYKRFDTKSTEIARYFRTTVNRRGYRFIRQKDLDKAEEMFKINTDYFPNSANTWDSLAEVYMLKGNKDLAIKYYKKSLKLNPNNTNAANQIKTLENEK